VLLTDASLMRSTDRIVNTNMPKI